MSDNPDSALPQLLRSLIELMKSSHSATMQGMAILQKESQDFRKEWQAFRSEIIDDVNSVGQTAALNSRRTPVPAWRQIRCIFMVHNSTMWDLLDGIYQAMRLADDFDPIVVTIPYEEEYWKRRFIRTEDRVHDDLMERDIPHLRLNMPDSWAGLDIIKALTPDIVFRQTPFDGPYPAAYRTAKLTFARLCYVPFGSFTTPLETINEGTELDAGLFYADKYFHQMCWRIFCETDMHRDTYKLASTRGGDNLVSVGRSAPKVLDAIRSGIAQERGEKTEEAILARPL